MKKTDITNGICYLEIPEVDLRILCGCPENSIKFIMQKGLTPSVKVNGFNLVSGPNAVLLNDYSIVNSHFLNFSEFPLLHHQFFQGASFNGTNEKFTLIGDPKKLEDQSAYIRHGLYGLISKDEILKAGVDEKTADRFLAISKFHRGEKDKFDILNSIGLNGKTQIKDELFVERIAINVFEFTYLNKRVVVDINIKKKQKGVGLPYRLKHQSVDFDDFSVTTVGDGNGWNPVVPCMGALLTYKGKRFLIDSGPGSLDLIRYLGVAPSEIDGMFITHSHDDHFAGILSMLNSERKLKFYSTAIVIASVMKKLEALLDLKDRELRKFIDFVPLVEGKWNNLYGLHINPRYSFHTIETNVFYFRSKNSAGQWKSYGHITDIISRKDLNNMVEHDFTGIIKKEWADSWFENYLHKTDYKKIDAGGGVVHGSHLDFLEDESGKIILSHLNKSIDTSAGSNFYKPTSFGYTEVLTKASKNYLRLIADQLLSELNFMPKGIKYRITDHEIITVKKGTRILRQNEEITTLYMVISGFVISYDSDGNLRKYTRGDILYSFENETINKFDFISATYVSLCRLTLKQMNSYLRRNPPGKVFKRLRKCHYFTYGISLKMQLDFANKIKVKDIKKGYKLTLDKYDSFILCNGKVEYRIDSKVYRTIKECELAVDNKKYSGHFFTTEESTLLFFSRLEIENFTSLLWSCLEESRRLETIVERGII